MGTPVLAVPASPPPPTTPANHVCHRRSRRVRSWNWLRVRLPDHRLRQEPLPQAAAPLLGHGTVLSYDGFPAALRLLSTGCVECRHLAPEERLLFPSYQLLFLELVGLFCSFM